METTTTFPIRKVQQLRRRAQEASKLLDTAPEGWSKSDTDPNRLLSVFSSLHLKSGFTLRAYQFRDGGNGNGIVWAAPEDLPFPDPKQYQKSDLPLPLLSPYQLDRSGFGLLHPPRPPGALDDVMEAIEGDGTPWSYLSASLLSREISEFGAMWHGCRWSTHVILGSDPWTSQRRSSKTDFRNCPSPEPEHWQWIEPKPLEWKPTVCESDRLVTVAFYTFSALGRERIYRHVDTYPKGRYRCACDTKVIAEGGAGYVF